MDSLVLLYAHPVLTFPYYLQAQFLDKELETQEI